VPLTLAASGTQTTTVPTEHTVANLEEAGSFVFEVDLAAAVAGDVFELRIKKRLLTSGTVRTIAFMAYYGAQPADDLIKYSVPISTTVTDADSIAFTIKQTFGSSRSIPWSVHKFT
jgi:hypothetical protein